MGPFFRSDYDIHICNVWKQVIDIIVFFTFTDLDACKAIAVTEKIYNQDAVQEIVSLVQDIHLELVGDSKKLSLKGDYVYRIAFYIRPSDANSNIVSFDFDSYGNVYLKKNIIQVMKKKNYLSC